jgi:hypothetical protein
MVTSGSGRKAIARPIEVVTQYPSSRLPARSGSTLGSLAEGDFQEGHAAIAAEHGPDAAGGTSRPELAPDEAEVTQRLSISDESSHNSTNH